MLQESGSRTGSRSELGSSDFPRSLCFMWFCFGLEILRLVYKKVFFKILNSFYLIWPFNFRKKQHRPVIRAEKKFFKIGSKGYQKFSFSVEFFSLLPNSRLLHNFEIGAKFRFFWYPVRLILKKFFFNSYKGCCYFFEG